MFKLICKRLSFPKRLDPAARAKQVLSSTLATQKTLSIKVPIVKAVFVAATVVVLVLVATWQQQSLRDSRSSSSSVAVAAPVEVAVDVGQQHIC